PEWIDAPIVHFYDIETHRDSVYLHGLVTCDAAGATVERQMLARDPSDERRAWHDLLDALASAPAGPIYCWTDFERTWARKLWSRHHGNASGYWRLHRNLVDLCAITRSHFALPTSTYGLKNVARLFGFTWQAEDANGLASEAWYDEWLKRESE